MLRLGCSPCGANITNFTKPGLLLRAFALSWKTFHKPNVLIPVGTEQKLGLVFFVFSQPLGLSKGTFLVERNSSFKDFMT